MYFSDKHQPELSYLGFRRLKPHPTLQAYIQCYWIIDARMSQRRQENFYPDGGNGLIFNFANPLQNHGMALVGGYYQGVDAIHSSITFHDQVETLGIRFHPGGSQAFLKIPATELKRPLYPLGELDGNFAALTRRLGNTTSWLQRIDMLEVHLLERKMAHPYQQIIHHTQNSLISLAIPPTIPKIADDLGLSSRTLQRIFKEKVGLSPKVLHRILRVGQIRRWLKEPKIPSYSLIGQELGYFDQAHFIRDFKLVVGMTPSAYRQRAITRGLYQNPTELALDY